MTNVFNEDPLDNTPPVTDPLLDALVGEGKKYKTVADLAKAYDNVNGFAETLKAEKREALAKADAAEARALATQQLLEARLRQPDQSENNRGPDHTPQRLDTIVPVDDEELESRIEKIAQKREDTQRATTNLNTVANKLEELYGDTTKANEAVKAKAAELGVSVEWLRSSAASSPAAFYNVMGITNAPPQNKASNAPRNDVNTLVLGNQNSVKPGTYQAYEELRKTDPKRYYNPKTQAEMHKHAAEMGDSFYT